MSLTIAIILFVTAFLALYWVFYGQRKYNEMLNPKRKTELKAIIFDLDGVIIDSFEAWFHVFNQTRRHFKLKEFSKKEFEKKAWGKVLSTELEKSFPGKKDWEVKEVYRALIIKAIPKIKMLPGSREVLHEIKKKGIKIGRVPPAPRQRDDYGLFKGHQAPLPWRGAPGKHPPSSIRT